MKKIKINELYPFDKVMDNTFFKIFDYLSNSQDLADFISSENISVLNQDYYLSHSSEKYISPFVEKLFFNGKTPVEIASMVATICINRFATKWKKIYDALMTEYNPLDNYNMEEIRTPDLTITEEQTEKNKSTTERETSANNSYKGFNAEEPVVINKTDGEESVVVSGSEDDNEINKTTEHTGTETLTRSGNIGVTTSQQMLTQELEVRKNDFYKIIYNDIDSVQCLSIY